MKIITVTARLDSGKLAHLYRYFKDHGITATTKAGIVRLSIDMLFRILADQGMMTPMNFEEYVKTLTEISMRAELPNLRVDKETLERLTDGIP